MRAIAPAVPDIVEEHLEEFAFLSLQRRRLIVDWETDVDEVREHDGRIEAHRDALRVAGPVAVQTVHERLEDPAASWDTYACARVLIEQSDLDADGLRTLLAKADDFQVDGWREAFRRTAPEHRLRLLPHAPLTESAAPVRAVAVDAAAWHGGLGEPDAVAALQHEDPLVRTFAARGLAWADFSSRDPALVLAEKIRDPDPRVARTALWSLALRSPASALSAARQELTSADGDPFALRVVGLLGDEKDLAGVARHARRPEALIALGDLGDVRALDVLLEQLGSEDPALGLAAAQGISRIAGFTEGQSDPPTEDTFDAAASRELAVTAKSRLSAERKWLRGLPFPPEGPAAEATTESLWRQTVRNGAVLKDPRAREVPDGFLTGSPDEQAECGV